MKKLFLASLVLFMAAACSNTKTESKTSGEKQDSTQVAAIYQCPMDCENGKTYDKAGQCPVCGMDLEVKS